MRTPIAWKNLVTDWRRLLLACAGIGFATVLMFMQNGFRNALLDSPVQMMRSLDCELVAVSRARYALPTEQRFARQLIDLARADADVSDVIPMYVELSRAQVRVIGKPQRPIRVVGVPARRGLFRNDEIELQIEHLAAPGTALLDRQTRRQFGFALEQPEQLANQSVELLGKRLRLTGTFEIGSDFAHEGTLIVGADTFADYFPFRGNGKPLSVVDFALIRTRSGADINDVARRLTELDHRAWQVMPRTSLIDREIAFWGEETPIGMIFKIGVLMGFAVGVIICYQVLFTSIHDSLAEYATLKAMGYPNRFFVALVIRQSIYLSLLGFGPGLLISLGLFQALQSMTGLPMLMTVPRALAVLGLTIAMCLTSGLLAVRKLLRADPASLF